jgi:NadR type nicotinamide-nucleotide adenylyltransferase
MDNKPLRIALIGPESSGKTTLCNALAAHFGFPCIQEYARSYLQSLTRPYTIEDIERIAVKQLELETAAAKIYPVLFCDTEFINFKVWCEHVFGSCPAWINNQVFQAPYDLYLLTQPDLPWEYDPLRENPEKGQFFFDWYKRLLTENGYRFVEIGGKENERLQQAIKAVSLLPGPWLKEK